ncbi:M28 family peptidase [Oscillatoria sp. FACHB-1406]|nr:M28 family peptidase [Oscillatoria sp. FACHB-1406]MBD2577112.1 M28 family peptidase [Oscillatoria sp. FACHB-1406]
MPKPSRRNSFKLKLVTRPALIRIAILLSTFALATIWAYFVLIWMPGTSYQGDFKPLQKDEIVLKELLQQDLQKLAGEIGSRNEGRYEKLNEAKTFLQQELTKAGYQVKQQDYKIDGQSYYNLEAEKLGSEKPDEIVVIGGHYDSAFTSPGANDNGTGAVATLELAKIFADRAPKRTLRFVEFTNEEPPFNWTEDMGSLVYARALKQKNEKIVAMLSLETIGYFSDAIGSQKYPFPIGLFYPSRGNFLAFIGNLESGSLVRGAIASFRRHASFPSEGASLPNKVPGVGWSDHWSFWQVGYPGIMITDTAPYRYPYYHTIDDTVDKIDFDRFTRVVTSLVDVIADLGNS